MLDYQHLREIGKRTGKFREKRREKCYSRFEVRPITQTTA